MYSIAYYHRRPRYRNYERCGSLHDADAQQAAGQPVARARGRPAVDEDGERVHQDAGPLGRGHHHRRDHRQAPRAAARHGGHLPHHAQREEHQGAARRLPLAAQDAVQARPRLLHGR